MRSEIQARLVELEGELRTGEARLRELELEAARLRETLLRISGATQVLRELLDGADAQDAADDGAPDSRAATVA